MTGADSRAEMSRLIGEAVHGPRPAAISFIVPLLAVMLLLGAICWAHNEDPFSRHWIRLATAGGRYFDCVAVLPKPVRESGVIIYAHDGNGSLMADGVDLRQMAEFGLAVVSLQYDETNQGAFDEEWPALLRFVAGQKWANTNAIAWVGFGAGAGNIMGYLRRHPDHGPRLFVSVAGTGIPGGEAGSNSVSFPGPALLVCGRAEGIQPALIRHPTGLHSPDLRVVPASPPDLQPERGVVFRGVGEYCLTRLTGPHAWRHYHSIAQWQAEAPPLWLFFLPAALVGAVFLFRRQSSGSSVADRQSSHRPPPGRGLLILRWFAAGLAAWTAVETALHLLPPHFSVCPTTVSLARRRLVPAGERADFDYLAARPIWTSVKLEVLLEHEQLAGYNRKLVNWSVDDATYREDVLSPVITGRAGEQLDWRRRLWEEFYPRIRHESNLDSAAKIVIRHLRERVTIAGEAGLPHEVSAIWLRQITDERGFGVIEVAALRSVGIPARLNPAAGAEYWDGRQWQPVPLPAVGIW